MSELRQTITYKYNFSEEEKAQNSQALAQENVKKVELEDEKKAAVSEYKAKIDAAQAQINLLTRHVIDGFTSKQIYARKAKDKENKVWVYSHPDTAEVLKVDPFSAKDYQTELFEEEQERERAEKEANERTVSGEGAEDDPLGFYSDTKSDATFNDLSEGEQSTTPERKRGAKGKFVGKKDKPDANESKRDDDSDNDLNDLIHERL